MNTRWMGLQSRSLWLATACGSPTQYDGQYRSQVWSDPPRPITVQEWVVFLDGWHRIIHAGNIDARSKGWPPAPPTIWQFSQSYDLPIGEWAIENAQRHGWLDMLALARKQAERLAYLRSLTPESRLSLFAMEREVASAGARSELGTQWLDQHRPGHMDMAPAAAKSDELEGAFTV